MLSSMKILNEEGLLKRCDARRIENTLAPSLSVSGTRPMAGARSETIVVSYAADSPREGRVVLCFPGTVFLWNWSADDADKRRI